jgi:3-oxosteroid 1-dehydrogenase
MTVSETYEADLIVVGSGGGGLTAAIAARAAGLRPLVLEKTAKIGGTTAFSGGLFWIPANPLMRDAGIEDSPAAGLAYLDALVAGRDPDGWRARREAFVHAGSPMVELLLREGLQADACPRYPDYYAELDGARLGGRPLEPRPFDTRQLGPWRERLRPQSTVPRKLRIQSSEFNEVSLALRSATGAATLARVMLRSGKALARRVPLAVGGEALAGRLLQIALRNGVAIETEASVDALWTDGDRVVGVIAGNRRIRAQRGVVLAAAGYAHNAEMRERFARQPTSTAWTKSSEGETGDMLRVAIELGAAVARMEEAWYSPMSIYGEGALIPHNLERAKPHAIIVDGTGRRFVNEASNYNRLGQRIYEHHRRTSAAIPSWLLLDSTHRRRYPFFTALPGRTPSAWIRSGYMKRGRSIRELATACGIDAAALEQTVERFNAMARAGRDEDFQRGDARYDAYWADPTVTPNPSLGPLERAPFYAVAIYPGDLGTCGGLVTSARAEVLREDGSAIDGLYATGNITAPLAAGEYWGAGASIGASMTFGYIAATTASVTAPRPAPAGRS